MLRASLVRKFLIVVVVVTAVLLQWRVLDLQDSSTGTSSTRSRPGTASLVTPLPQGPLSGKSIGLVIGHWSREAVLDPGALCLDRDGVAELSELEINQHIAQRVAAELEALGARVWLLEEKDDRLHGLFADLALSLHADSCIEATGFKAAYTPGAAMQVQSHAFVECLRTEYAAHTGLDWHAYSITDDMLHYHMHEKVANSTPAVILEMGFMGGDRQLLTQQPDRVRDGIIASVRCFLTPDDYTP